MLLNAPSPLPSPPPLEGTFLRDESFCFAFVWLLVAFEVGPFFVRPFPLAPTVFCRPWAILLFRSDLMLYTSCSRSTQFKLNWDKGPCYQGRTTM